MKYYSLLIIRHAKLFPMYCTFKLERTLILLQELKKNDFYNWAKKHLLNLIDKLPGV